jgi:two-component system, LytTR family, sensor kinase
MEFPQVFTPAWPSAATQPVAPAAEPAGSARAALAMEPRPWSVIWRVGGVCWLLITGTALLAPRMVSSALPAGNSPLTVGACAAQHLLVFLAAALAYRAAIALGWPGGVGARTRVAAANTLLALAVVASSSIALALAAGLIDRQPPGVRAALGGWLASAAGWEWWTLALQHFLSPYLLGLCAIALVRVRGAQRALQRAAELDSTRPGLLGGVLPALKPHFLFNSLHAVSVLIDDSPPQAVRVLSRLGDFLRHILEGNRRPWVEVAAELSGVEAYLAIQQLRFPDQLRVAVDASAESLALQVPPLLLQPLVENAIEHGRNAGVATLSVRVTVAVRRKRLHIAVSNSSPRLQRELAPCDYRHGLTALSLRLRTAYGADARLSVGPDASGGTHAVLELPLRRSVHR